MGTPPDWVALERYGYSPSRYDPDTRPPTCEGCGGRLLRGGGADTVTIRCTDCGYDVFKAPR